MPAATENAPVSRIFPIFIGLSLILVGGFFVWLLGRSFLHALEMRGWPQTECVMLISEIEERKFDRFSRQEYRWNMEFGYEFRGKRLTSNHHTVRENPWSADREKAAALVGKFPAGSRQTCRVNPDRPEIAILKPDSLAPGYSIWFPALFVIGGAGIVYRTFRPARRKIRRAILDR